MTRQVAILALFHFCWSHTGRIDFPNPPDAQSFLNLDCPTHRRAMFPPSLPDTPNASGVY